MIKTDRYTLYLDDCRNVLKQLNDNSVDLIITDPPYFIDGMGNDWNKENLSKKVKKAKVVGGLPVGMKFDVEQGKKLQEFIEPICNEFMRILKPGGFVLYFHKQDYIIEWQ